MLLVRLTRLPRARLRLQVQLQLRPISKPRPHLLPALHQHLHQLAPPVRARSQVLLHNPVPVRNRVRARSQPQAQTPLHHRPVSSMDIGTMKFSLVGRGSRAAENCFRSSRRSEPPNAARPINPPSRGTRPCQVFKPDLRPHPIVKQSSLWVRLGELVGLAHTAVGTSRRPCDYHLVVREPRPTKVVVTSHLSLFTSHLSLQGYVCS
jgi:hypothetical protein